MFVTLVILSNAALIGIRANDDTERQFRPLFNTADSAVLAIFVLEMLLKMYASFTLYWHVSEEEKGLTDRRRDTESGFAAEPRSISTNQSEQMTS